MFLNILLQLMKFFYSNMKFKTKLFAQTVVRTAYVAEAQKLGNPTSSPGAHFRHWIDLTEQFLIDGRFSYHYSAP
jgi:hypothetical protein